MMMVKAKKEEVMMKAKNKKYNTKTHTCKKERKKTKKKETKKYSKAPQEIFFAPQQELTKKTEKGHKKRIFYNLGEWNNGYAEKKNCREGRKKRCAGGWTTGRYQLLCISCCFRIPHVYAERKKKKEPKHTKNGEEYKKKAKTTTREYVSNNKRGDKRENASRKKKRHNKSLIHYYYIHT